MGNSGLTASDVLALSNENGFGNGGGWFVWLILIIAMFGGNGWGYNNGVNMATSADIQRSTDQIQTNARFDSLFNNQARNMMESMSLIDRNELDNIRAIAENKYENALLIKDAQYTNMQNTNTLTNTMNQGFNGINYNLNDGFRGIDKAICQSTWQQTQAMNDGFAGVNQNLNNISHQISDGVCAIKTQLLQDKYDKLLNEFNLSTMANANSIQTNNILNTLGSWYAKPPVYPYNLYGTTVS